MKKIIIAVVLAVVTIITGCTNTEILAGGAIATGALILANESNSAPRHSPPPPRRPAPRPRRY